jgi:hypothetical protein
MLAVVRGKDNEAGFLGLARDMSVWPDTKSRSLDTRLEERGWTSFDEVLTHWERTLPALGSAFAQGSAVVDPVEPIQVCQYCDLTSLCRIHELDLLIKGEPDA